MVDLRYPIGKFAYEGQLSEAQKQKCLSDIEQAPVKLRAAVAGLSNAQPAKP